MSQEELTYLAHAASKSMVIAEIGSYSGRSTLALAVNAPAGSIVYACDHWQGSADHQEMLSKMPPGWLFDDFTTNMQGITNVWPLAVNSLQAARWMATQGKRFDLIFIDASHDFESVKADILAWRPLLKDGGILCGHDYDDLPNPGVKQAVDLLIPKFRVIGTIWTTEEEWTLTTER
jgi:predicted O-methyltransferase YrrM